MTKATGPLGILRRKARTMIALAGWMKDFTGPWPLTALTLLVGRNFRSLPLRGQYRSMPFTFRGRDLPALREVLHDREYQFLAETLARDNPVILDVGAHIGLFGLWALGVNPAARLLSVEASPDTYKILLRNAAALTKRGRYWHAMLRAACDAERPVRISGDFKGSMSHRMAEDGAFEVQGITLPGLIAATGATVVDLMKVDIEGAEELFLCSHPDALKNVRALAIELHPGVCDTARVEHVLRDVFPSIAVVPQRVSSKPLLFCWR